MEVFRPYGFDKTLFFTTLILLAFGLIMVFSSSAVLATEKYHQPLYFFINQIIGIVMGLLLVFAIISIRTAFYQKTFFIYGMLLITLASLAACLVMPAFANTNRWIIFFGIRFQPSELAKISLILFLASYLERKRDKLNEVQTLFLPLSVVALAILLVLKEPDYGTALFLFMLCVLVLFVGGITLKFLAYLGLISLVPFVFFLFKASYRWSRILAFISPAEDPLGTGFQVIQSKLAVGSGGLLGVSLGESIQKLFFLPCAHTDYIYAIIGEELGLLGTVAVLLLFCIFFWRGLAISMKAVDRFSQIAAAGLTLAIFFQALLNISIVLGLGPPTGVPLPLISFGRSSLVCSLFSIGILLHISQRKGSFRKNK